MKKVQYLTVFVFLPLLIILLIGLNIILSPQRYKGFKTTNYRLEGRIYKLLVADTPQKWEKGLMNFKELERVSGMLFIFPDKKPRTFWNKNTYLDLNLYWINDEKVVGKSFLPSILKSKNVLIIQSPKPVDKVAEIISSKPQSPAMLLFQ